MQKTCCILMAGGKLQSPRKNLSSSGNKLDLFFTLSDRLIFCVN